MAYSVKDWKNRGDAGPTTPMNAGALEDLEYRLSQRSEYVASRMVFLASQSGSVTLSPGDSPNVLYIVTEAGSVTYSIDTANWVPGGWMELRCIQPATPGTRVLPKHFSAGGVGLGVTTVGNAIDRYGFSNIPFQADPDGFELALDIKDSSP